MNTTSRKQRCSVNQWIVAASALAMFCGCQEAPTAPETSVLPPQSSNGTVWILQPNGGNTQTFHAGDTIDCIIRTNADYPLVLVFSLSIDEGRSWYELSEMGGVDMEKQSTDTFEVTLPDSLVFYDASGVMRSESVASRQCYLRVKDYDHRDTDWDISDRTFTIAYKQGK
jgi:hypothetical protein